MRKLAFEFDSTRFALGGGLLSVGTGAVALEPSLKVAGIVLFIVGFVLLISGLIGIKSRSVVVYNEWSLSRVKRALKEAKPDATVRILQTWFPEEEFIDCLQDYFIHEGKKFDLRLLLLDAGNPPSGGADLLSARVKLRGVTREKAATEIQEAIEGLIQLKENVDLAWREASGRNHRAPILDMEIRLYDFLPFGPIYQIGDDLMFVGFFLNYDTSAAGPMIELRKDPLNRIWRKFEKDFLVGWDDARVLQQQITPSPATPPP